MKLRKCKPVHTDTVATWLREHHPVLVEQSLLHWPKDYAAKVIRDELHRRGITRAGEVYLSRTQVRQALTRFRRLPVAEREAALALPVGTDDPERSTVCRPWLNNEPDPVLTH